MIIINDNIVKLTSGFLHWLKLIGETEQRLNNILVNIITNIEKMNDFKIEYIYNTFNLIKIK